jgi:hypothetical protein
MPGVGRSNMKLRIGRDTPDGDTSDAVGVAGEPAVVTSNLQRIRERDLILTIKPCRWPRYRVFLRVKWDRNADHVRKGTVPMFHHAPAHHAMCVALRR